LDRLAVKFRVNKVNQIKPMAQEVARRRQQALAEEREDE
jgi:hypothetical protein